MVYWPAGDDELNLTWLDNEWIEDNYQVGIIDELPVEWDSIDAQVGHISSLGFYSIEN